jgi:hypothetical protein
VTPPRLHLKAKFVITSLEPGQDGVIHVHVRYPAGVLILPYKSTLPESAIIAQVRAEVRRRVQNAPPALERLAGLLGEHDL